MKTNHKFTRTLSTSDLSSVKGAGLFSDVISTLDRWISGSSTTDSGSKSTTTGRHAEREAASTAH